ncbi:MAG: tRNA preQ1(34) S-adenosylmethionine ribosyltransferase-isomerase QueA [Gemmatimonadota bacterium]|nr:tRNA preQ1(34) S-adenosylmethionine ribosyltransferase-isomerase QueA [Gemmatimonadota bacterium]
MPSRGDRTADYDFHLPPDRIAQTPLERRDASRLLVVRRCTGQIEHRGFGEIAELISPGDAIVLNTTRVIRARLLGKRASGGPAEVMLLHPTRDDLWEAMVSPGGKLRPGRTVTIAPELAVDILEITERRTRIVRLRASVPIAEAIARHGHVPLPPYIARGDTADDAGRYQTVYAREDGSVAAPTAGLHFTPELLDTLAARGVQRVDVLLHVGAGTFKPVEVDDPANHAMHEEWFSLPAAAAAALNRVRAGGGHIWAVGTTSARTLESAVRPDGSFEAASGDTRLFIRPGYSFRAVDKLITNFHLPRSTLVMLVAALAGYDLTMNAYRVAIDAGYRFYSYGDAMAVV